LARCSSKSFLARALRQISTPSPIACTTRAAKFTAAPKTSFSSHAHRPDVDPGADLYLFVTRIGLQGQGVVQGFVNGAKRCHEAVAEGLDFRPVVFPNQLQALCEMLSPQKRGFRTMQPNCRSARSYK
jgi:hypothetical protein